MEDPELWADGGAAVRSLQAPLWVGLGRHGTQTHGLLRRVSLALPPVSQSVSQPASSCFSHALKLFDSYLSFRVESRALRTQATLHSTARQQHHRKKNEEFAQNHTHSHSLSTDRTYLYVYANYAVLMRSICTSPDFDGVFFSSLRRCHCGSRDSFTSFQTR